MRTKSAAGYLTIDMKNGIICINFNMFFLCRLNKPLHKTNKVSNCSNSAAVHLRKVIYFKNAIKLIDVQLAKIKTGKMPLKGDILAKSTVSQMIETDDGLLP
jgi:hypothetical protein